MLCSARSGSRAGPSARARAQQGIAAIETAIIMIAFVVVASVTAMTTLNTGLFAAEEGKKAILSGLSKARGSLVLRGSAFAMTGSVDVDGDDLINLNGADQQAVVKVTFVVNGALQDAAVDLTPPYTVNDTGVDPDASGLDYNTVVSFRSQDASISDAAWTVDFIGSDDGDYILESNERAEITVWLQKQDLDNAVWDLGAGSSDPFLDDAASLLQSKTQFTIELHSSAGGVLGVRRTIPKQLDAVMNLN